MIIFYDKKTGKIIGTIEGRKHTEEHLNMWIGNRNETERIVVEWDQTGQKKEIKYREFEPQFQKDIFAKLDRLPGSFKEYRVDLKSKKLIPDTRTQKV